MFQVVSVYASLSVPFVKTTLSSNLLKNFISSQVKNTLYLVSKRHIVTLLYVKMSLN